MEPTILRKGKEFHRLVQSDWFADFAAGSVKLERSINLQGLPLRGNRVRRGRMDIFIDKIEDYVTIVEIKATNWDQIKPTNRRKLLGSHQRQVWKYIARYLDEEKTDVFAGIIYPKAPKLPSVREEIETLLGEHFLQVVWYDEK